MLIFNILLSPTTTAIAKFEKEGKRYGYQNPNKNKCRLVTKVWSGCSVINQPNIMIRVKKFRELASKSLAQRPLKVSLTNL